MNNKVAAFGQRRAGVYLLSEIYNPDESSSVQNINKVIPAIGSLVVDDTVGEHNTLYVVYSVDAVTHKCTLVNVAYVNGEDMVGDTKDLRMLFYDPVAKPQYYVTQDAVRQTGVNYYTKDPTTEAYGLYVGAFEQGVTYYEMKELYEVQIDSRISVFTSLATDYTIFHAATASGTGSDTEVVSQYYIGETSPSNLSLIEDTEVPMDRITIPATGLGNEMTETDAYRPRICYSTDPLIVGDKYLVVVRSNGHVISQFTLTGQSMSALADLNNARKTIVNMTVGGNQYDSANNRFYITQDQKLDQLTFYLRIHYEDGEERVWIDDQNAFMYIDESYATATPNSVIPVVFKYFLSPSENLGLTNNQARQYAIGPTGRYITIKSSIVITETTFSSISKIAPILYCAATSPSIRYKIIPVVYKSDGSEPEVAIDIDPTNGPFAVNDFDGGNTSTEQLVTLKYTIVSNGVSSTFPNIYRIRLNPANTANGVYYYFSDNATTTYGKDPRPNMIQTSGNQYQFGISRTGGNYNNADGFLQRYYYNANPPAPYSSANPTRPDYFRIRRITVGSGTGTLETAIAFGPVEIDAFFAQEPSSQIIAANRTLHSTTSMPATALLEFLKKNNDNTYQVLYGVPVDVIRS